MLHFDINFRLKTLSLFRFWFTNKFIEDRLLQTSMKRQFNSVIQETIADLPVKRKKSSSVKNKVESNRATSEKDNSHCNHDCEPFVDNTAVLSSPDLNPTGSQLEICDVPDLVGDTNSNSVEKEIEDAILALATKRGVTKTLCPSEIPRLILKYKNWRDYMDLTRKVAFRMAHSGIVDIMQQGNRRNTDEFGSIRGPIRLQLRLSEPAIETL